MAETSRLLICRACNSVPRVRIPPLPPSYNPELIFLIILKRKYCKGIIGIKNIKKLKKPAKARTAPAKKLVKIDANPILLKPSMRTGIAEPMKQEITSVP